MTPTWRLRVHPNVKADVRDAARFLKQVDYNYALSFAPTVKAGNKTIRKFPLSHREYLRDWRRYVLQPYPYLTIFAVVDNTVYVVAIVDGRRDPNSIENLLNERAKWEPLAKAQTNLT